MPPPSTPFYDRFEIDIITALSEQLVTAFGRLSQARLDSAHIAQVPQEQGVYKLWHKGSLVYVGKADRLGGRLDDHRAKISGRRNISLTDMTFSTLLVHRNWTALAPEAALIRHYRTAGSGCEWNGNGFGPHDPGRDRETTNKPPDGFDNQYPIEEDWPCPWFTSPSTGSWNCLDLLLRLKSELPYLLRFELDHGGHFKSGHADQRAATIPVPASNPPTTARAILHHIAASMPGWQATVFPSHMIFYKESRHYRHGHPA